MTNPSVPHVEYLPTVLTWLGFLSGFVGLIFIFPLLGHATWHAYRHIVGQSPPVN